MPFPTVDAAPARPGQAAPTAAQERIAALDVTRGIALLGILLMNIVAMGLPYQATNTPTAIGGAEGINLATWFVTATFFEGTMRTLFSALFGAGAILLVSRLEDRMPGMGPADIYYRRTIGLILLGLLNAYVLLWPGDILYAYGLVGLFLFPLRKVPVRWLLVIAAVLVLARGFHMITVYDEFVDMKERGEQALVLEQEGAELTEEQQQALETWAGEIKHFQPSDEILDESIETGRSGYGTVFSHLAGVNWKLHGQPIYSSFHGDVLLAMLLGMALFKSGILPLQASRRTIVTMTLVGYGIGLPLNFYETWIFFSSGFDVSALFRGWITYDIGRLSLAAGHLGVILLVCRSGALPRLQRACAAVGRMALTNYLLQSVLAAFIFFGFGLALFGALERHQLYFVVAGIWAVNIALSLFWLKRFRYGPVEWLWRSFTYLSWQPIRRDAGLVASTEPKQAA